MKPKAMQETHKRFEGQLEDTAQSLEELQTSVVDSRMRNLVGSSVPEIWLSALIQGQT